MRGAEEERGGPAAAQARADLGACLAKMSGCTTLTSRHAMSAPVTEADQSETPARGHTCWHVFS